MAFTGLYHGCLDNFITANYAAFIVWTKLQLCIRKRGLGSIIIQVLQTTKMYSEKLAISPYPQFKKKTFTFGNYAEKQADVLRKVHETLMLVRL